MCIIKSFSVGTGDMFYIHEDDNLTIIDCGMREEDEAKIIEELYYLVGDNDTRLIITHSDGDHARGFNTLRKKFGLNKNMCFCTKLNTDEYIRQRCTACLDTSFRAVERLNVLWPTNNKLAYTSVIESWTATDTNLSCPILYYETFCGVTAMWMGDLQIMGMNTTDRRKLYRTVKWPKVDILFAPHHGLESGEIPEDILKKLDPKVVVIGEFGENGESAREYYDANCQSADVILQEELGDITFVCVDNTVKIFASKDSKEFYDADLYYNIYDDEEAANDIDNEYYIGTFDID